MIRRALLEKAKKKGKTLVREKERRKKRGGGDIGADQLRKKDRNKDREEIRKMWTVETKGGRGERRRMGEDLGKRKQKERQQERR